MALAIVLMLIVLVFFILVVDGQIIYVILLVFSFFDIVEHAKIHQHRLELSWCHAFFLVCGFDIVLEEVTAFLPFRSLLNLLSNASVEAD